MYHKEAKKGECNNRLFSKSLSTNCKTPEHREGWSSCFLHDKAWDFFFFHFGKKKSLSTWALEKHFWWAPNQSIGLQMLVAVAQIRKALKSSRAFQTHWAWSLLFWLLPPIRGLQASHSSQGWCFQRPGSAALWPGQGHILHQQPTAWAPCGHAAQAEQWHVSIISPDAQHHLLASCLSLSHQNCSSSWVRIFLGKPCFCPPRC